VIVRETFEYNSMHGGNGDFRSKPKDTYSIQEPSSRIGPQLLGSFSTESQILHWRPTQVPYISKGKKGREPGRYGCTCSERDKQRGMQKLRGGRESVAHLIRR